MKTKKAQFYLIAAIIIVMVVLVGCDYLESAQVEDSTTTQEVVVEPKVEEVIEELVVEELIEC